MEISGAESKFSDLLHAWLQTLPYLNMAKADEGKYCYSKRTVY